MFWSRDQVAPAAARWPDLVQVDGVVRQRELDNRQLVAENGCRIVMVPISVAHMVEFTARTGGDPRDPITRTRLLHERHEQGAWIAWPPGRNNRCWCGSKQKYKLCCGTIERIQV